MRTHGNARTIVPVLNYLSSHQCTELRELCQVSMSIPIAGYGLWPGCLQRIVRITMATREALARKLRELISLCQWQNLRRRRFVRRAAKPRSQARRHFQGRHCASNMIDDRYRPMGSQYGWLGKCSGIAKTSGVPPFENNDQKENRSCYLQLRLYCASCGHSASLPRSQWVGSFIFFSFSRLWSWGFGCFRGATPPDRFPGTLSV